jgi:hypothetical protein
MLAKVFNATPIRERFFTGTSSLEHAKTGTGRKEHYTAVIAMNIYVCTKNGSKMPSETVAQAILDEGAVVDLI